MQHVFNMSHQCHPTLNILKTAFQDKNLTKFRSSENIFGKNFFMQVELIQNTLFIQHIKPFFPTIFSF